MIRGERGARLRPPPALILLGVLAGLVVTLLGLSSMSGPPPGCDLGDGGRLTGVVRHTVADGAPLRWLTAAHGAPVVNWTAMASDWAQDAVLSVAAVDGWWLATRARSESSGPWPLADTALWALVALGGWLAVRMLLPWSLTRRRSGHGLRGN